MKKRNLFLTSLIILFVAGLFISQYSATASVTSKKYKEYKAKYKNKEDKTTYFKIKTLKKDNPKLYLYYKSICDIHKFDTEKQFQSLPKRTQDFCNDYYTYRGYSQYVNWRNKHRNSSSNETTTAAPFVCGTSQIEDADGNTYNTVQVNDQCWMAENLNVGTMLASGATEPVNNSTIEKWCYNNDTSICDTDGGLYNWNEAMQYVTTEGAQGICPTGWHIPTDAQWYALENYLKDEGQVCVSDSLNTPQCSSAANKLKSGGSSGFDALFTGYKGSDGTFNYRTTRVIFWTSLQFDSTKSWRRFFASSGSTTIRGYDNKILGVPIRCLKD